MATSPADTNHPSGPVQGPGLVGRQGPTYLARRSYRQRRLRDAARMLPILGTILWLLPVAATTPRTAVTGIYIFGVWILLIILAAMLSRRIDHAPQQDDNVGDL